MFKMFLLALVACLATSGLLQVNADAPDECCSAELPACSCGECLTRADAEMFPCEPGPNSDGNCCGPTIITGPSTCSCPTVIEYVCNRATGQEWDNPCKATCIDNENGDDLSPGRCPDDTEVPPLTPCFCTTLFSPVCNQATGAEYSNRCTAVCNGEDELDLSPGRCPEEPVLPVPPPSCSCPAVIQYVCNRATGEEWDHPCKATCNGANQAEDLTPGRCPPNICTCEEELAPVCNAATQSQYSNLCDAVDCYGENEQDLTTGPCGGPNAPGLFDWAKARNA